MGRLVEPLVYLGVFDSVGADTDLSDELKAIHTPGHTPGHMSTLGRVCKAGDGG